MTLDAHGGGIAVADWHGQIEPEERGYEDAAAIYAALLSTTFRRTPAVRVAIK